MPSTPGDMRQAIIHNLPEKTGRSLEEWIEVLRASAPEGKRKERIAWLQGEHGLGHGQASMVVDSADRPEVFEQRDPAELMEELFAGRERLRPVYEAVRTAMLALGPEVTAAPRQTYVTFSRGRQFALAQPSTATRLDIGLVLPGVEPTERLQDAGSFGSGRITHRLALGPGDELDAELLAWLRQAYERA